MPTESERSTRPFVVFVEDDEAMAAMYRLGLEAAGFEVAVFADGSGLFQVLDRRLPDAVILDWQLQGILTGGDILTNLRLDDRAAEVPVFFLSNYGDQREGDSRAAGDRAVEAWLLKARTTPQQLATRLRTALEPA